MKYMSFKSIAILGSIALWGWGCPDGARARVTYLDIRMARPDEENREVAKRREPTSTPSEDVPANVLPQTSPIIAAPDSVTGSTTTVSPVTEPLPGGPAAAPSDVQISTGALPGAVPPEIREGSEDRKEER